MDPIQLAQLLNYIQSVQTANVPVQPQVANSALGNAVYTGNLPAQLQAASINPIHNLQSYTHSGLPVMQTPVSSTFIQQPLQTLNPASHQYSAAEVALLLEQQRLQLQQQQQVPLYMQPSTQNIQTSSYGYSIPTEQLSASMVSPSFPNIQQPLYNLYPNFSTPANVLPTFIQRYGTAQNPIEMNALPNVQP